MDRIRLITAGAIAAGALASGAIATTAGAFSASAASTQVLKLTADPHGNLKFNTKALTAHTGTIQIRMMNPKSSGLTHGIAVSGHGQFVQSSRNANPSQTVTVTVKITKPGKYEFLCPISGHAMAGMKGTLTVS